MRKRFAFSIPSPRGGGFLLAAVIVASSAMLPAQAANVTVGLRVSLGGYAASIVDCDVSVAQGANGSAVLAAADRAGCIASYQTGTFTGFGTYVQCIDPNAISICEQGGGLVTFWAYYKNGANQVLGIDAFNAAAGDELALIYTNFATCPTYPECPL